MKKYAFVLMGNYDPARHTAEFTAGSSLTRLTGGAMAIGYVTHDPAQDHLFRAFFGD